MSTSTSTTPFASRRSGGVRHAPEADIESIRDLLQGCGSARSILKELIQNAEDANATRMDLLYLKGDPTSPFALLKGPGLLVANNGVFTEGDRDAITQINLGTKGTDERAIGRFGKGLKSIFAWCEAFFIIARTDLALGRQDNYIVDFFNPWHGWRRGEWDDEFSIHWDILAAETVRHLNTIYPVGKPWLALWFPLRHRAQGGGAQVADEWISSLFPGNNPEFYETFSSELRSLAPSLVTLRSLQRIEFIDCTADPRNSITLQFPSQSQRVPPPGATAGFVSHVNGTMLLHGSVGRDMEYQYCGLAGHLRNEEVAHLQDADDWRKVVQRTQISSSASHRAKGKPHFATLIASTAVSRDEKLGSLDLRWCVFFPVGKQPPGQLPLTLPDIRRHITINLHGFFFLDSDRLRIDGLEESFSPSSTTTQKTSLEWNRIVATHGTLARLPEAIAAFAEQQSFNNLQSRELADAVRQTWPWKEFQEAICHISTWRPRWRSGVETWNCISKQDSVLVIPTVADHREVLARVPALGPISEEFTLVAGTDEVTLPGLHRNTADGWPEELVLRLLENVQLASTGGQATANWLNRFLNDLHRNSAITPAIRERAVLLHLLPARDPATNTPVRLNAREWVESIDSGRLFTNDPESIRWITMLRSLLPDWSCHVAYAELPNWSSEPRPPICNAAAAADIILKQNSLGDFVHRSQLVDAFASSIHRDFKLRLAMRYLLHGEASDRHDQTKTLFLPSTQQREQIWPRLIEQLLDNEGGVDSWRLLHEQWAPILSLQVQQELKVATVDAAGAWIELRKGETELSSLAFPSDDWSGNDVFALLQGLFQAAQSKGDDAVPTLRKLRLHTLRGHPDDRVAVADSEGKLRDGFVLDAPIFESDLTLELRALWEKFLSKTNIVELIPTDTLASKVQQDIFREEVDGLDRLIQLDWNFVVRRSLFSEFPCEWAPLIMEAISRQGSQSISGVGPKFRETKWLPLALGGEIAPEDVVHIEGLEEELHRLLDPANDGWAAILALPEWVCKHAGFSTLRNMLPSKEKALEIVGLWLEDKSAWHLGLSKEFQIPELKLLLAQLRDFEDLPVAALVVKLQCIGLREDRDKIDSLLTKYILPKILKSFDYRQNGPARIAAILQRLQREQSRAAFDSYLTQACQDRVVATILPELSLVNQLGKWVPSRQLIWPSLNLNPAVQLCTEQSGILQSLHERSGAGEWQTIGGQQGTATIVANQLTEAPDFEAEAKKLSEYLKPFRTGNVGENLPAALVAVLGGHAANQTLLQELLDAGLRRQPDDFLAQLLGEKTDDLAPSVKSERFLIEIVKGESCTVANVIGETIVVEFTKEITSLLVGDPSVLWRRHYYQNRPDTACHLLRLRWIETPDDLSDRVAVFASTIETILLKVHCNSVSGRCPSNIKEVLQRIADAGQADLRRSQSYLLDMAEARLKELGVRKIPEFSVVLQEFAKARDRRVDAEELCQQAPAIARQREEDAKRLVETAKQELRRLLVSPEELGAQLSLVEAVRRKMDEFQYDLRSVAFEMFQNADDAVAELEEMQNGANNPGLRRFVLQVDSERGLLEFFHWGRPINCYEYPGFQQGLTLGYDQDLQKMLTLSFSDKGVQPENRPSIVTGRFGLGFKSVFFISERPEVVSGRLAFEIRGGFFPVPLLSETAKEIRDRAATLSESRLAPTAIRLKWEISRFSQIADAIDDFTAVAPVLTVFSRCIRSLTVSKNAETETWTITEKSITASGRATYAQVGNTAFLCFRCSLRSDQRPATVLFQVGSNGISHLPDHLSGLWITTPTAERSDLKYALNAPFKPDAGRQRLALNNPDNRAVATDVASMWKEALIELFDETREHWNQFATILRLHSNAGFDSWWRELWKLMTRNNVPVVHWDPIGGGNGGQILSWIAWGKSIGAMRGLIQQRPAIPSELPDHYARLVRQGDVRFSVVGLLAKTENGCFAHIADWRSTQAAFPVGQTVRSDIADFLKRAEFLFEVEKVTLESVLKAAVGTHNRVDHQTGDRIGTLLIECDAALQSNTFDAPEVQQLHVWLKEIRLLGKDCAYHPADELVCGRSLSGVIDADEARRAAFAPDASVLSEDYSDAALRVFIKARPRLTAGASSLATWTREASHAKLLAVFGYLVHGVLGQELADQLERPWLETKIETPPWRELSPEEQHEVKRKFQRWSSTDKFIDVSPPNLNREIRPEINSEDAFRLVSAWWKENEARYIAEYEDKTYPPGFPGTLPWPGENEWDVVSDPSAQARWLILFIHAALVPLGFNKIGRDQSFSQFLVSHRWLSVLAKIHAEPEAVLNALDDYLDGFIQNTRYHFQMRQFVAFYSVAKNIEPLLLSLREADRSSGPESFSSVFSPKANPALSGTGIDAPPVNGMLGIGTCQLLRELYRLRRLTNSSGYRFAFTPIRKVRRLCNLLFGVSDMDISSHQSSREIFEALNRMGERCGLDATFNHCFDLPFQFLAEDEDLRGKVLQIMISDESLRDVLDAAPDEVES
ncbi:MAG: hypothetical protein JWQ49_1778 [Edaphobacter sp.]|nr:hypothetical protein [Edaphobacter sp.]